MFFGNLNLCVPDSNNVVFTSALKVSKVKPLPAVVAIDKPTSEFASVPILIGKPTSGANDTSARSPL